MKKIIHILLALVTWATVLAQYFLMIENRVAPVGETTVRFFSFFTILTNILVASYFTIASFKHSGRVNNFIERPATVTAITLYVGVVGLVYQVLLRHIWQPQGLQMVVDELLHTFIPLAVFLYWLLFRGKSELSYRALPYWLIYPCCCLVFIIIRGNDSGFYPYPFVHVANLGLPKVLFNSLFLLAFFVLLSLLLIFFGTLKRRTS